MLIIEICIDCYLALYLSFITQELKKNLRLLIKIQIGLLLSALVALKTIFNINNYVYISY